MSLPALERWRGKGTDPRFIEKDDALYLRHNKISLLGYALAACLIVTNLIVGRFFEAWLYFAPLLIVLLLTGVRYYRFGRWGRLLARVGQGRLILELSGASPSRIEVALQTLRALTIETPASVLRFEHVDGTVQIEVALYDSNVKPPIIDFLRRKLPSSVVFTVDSEGPSPGRSRPL
jgi:hypothetical protein